MAESSKLSPTDTPKYLSTDIDEKINALKRETNYFLTKAQRFVPKSKTTATPKVPVNEKSPEPESTTTTTTEGIAFHHLLSKNTPFAYR